MTKVESWIVGILIGAGILVIGGLVMQFGDGFSVDHKFAQYGLIGIGVGLLIIVLSAYTKYKS